MLTRILSSCTCPGATCRSRRGGAAESPQGGVERSDAAAARGDDGSSSRDASRSVYYDARSELGTSATAGDAAGSAYYDAEQSYAALESVGSRRCFRPSLGKSLDDRGSVLGPRASRPPGHDGVDERPSARRLRGPRSLIRRGGTGRRGAGGGGGGSGNRSSLLFRRRLEGRAPGVPSEEAGFPGHLTEEELEACLEFRRRLLNDDDDDNVYREMVYCFEEVEEEPYAICRYLRARKFDVDAAFRMMDERADLWREGRKNAFFPDPSGIGGRGGGAPESALLTQFPLVLGSRTAPNGCPLVYFTTGKVVIEGIECMITLEDLPNYIWHFAVHKVKRRIASALAEDPSLLVRVQAVVIVDLNGLALSTLKRAMGALEQALGVLNVFPEFLYSVVILHAPRFFAAFWPLIKSFMDPDTARKFELFSNASRGRRRLLELVPAAELASDYGGAAPSTAKEVVRCVAPREGRGASRQVTELLAVPRRGGEAVCTLELAENEIAAFTVHTKSSDVADVILTRGDEKDPLVRVQMTRNGKEAAGGAFFRGVASPSLRGPGKFSVAVRQQSGLGRSGSDYFLVVGYLYPAGK